MNDSIWDAGWKYMLFSCFDYLKIMFGNIYSNIVLEIATRSIQNITKIYNSIKAKFSNVEQVSVLILYSLLFFTASTNFFAKWMETC